MARPPMETLNQYRAALKSHLEENDGELVYWGETIRPDRHSRMFLSGIQDRQTNGIHEFTEPDSRFRGNDDRGENGVRLEELRTQTIGDCRLCPLGDTRIKLTFGVGNAEAQVMFIGEGPGFEEDRKGEPFVGKAGQLLDKIMSAINLDRAKVYIANIVKCHPMVDPAQPDKRGNDRPPTPEEMEKCRPFLMEQIRIIRPKIIVTLGGVSTKSLLQTTQGITALRGKWTTLHLDGMEAIRVLPTFHPAALLRDESLKKSVWEDMKLLRAALNDE